MLHAVCPVKIDLVIGKRERDHCCALIDTRTNVQPRSLETVTVMCKLSRIE